ncbi:hypothetical protein ACFQ2B_26125 [Streptomyces stramineus]|uniref:Uncharacterized protein n=1 Tax=Streptomyces stramineus TaxID=173861 RepID=A0ABN0ZQN0_9ACTN
MSTFTLRLTPEWERGFFLAPEMRDLVELHTVTLAGAAAADAPHPSRPTKEHWNTVRRSITPHLALDRDGWYGQVVVEADARMRHAMLLERGWGDGQGRKYARWYLKRALERQRIE